MPPQPQSVPAMSARQQTRAKYLANHPNAGQRPPQQGAAPMSGQPQNPVQQSGWNPQQMQPMPGWQGQPQAMPRPAPGQWPGQAPNGSPLTNYGPGQGQQIDPGFNQQWGQQGQSGFQDMMYRFPPGQGPSFDQFKNGLGSAFGGQIDRGSIMPPEQFQQMYPDMAQQMGMGGQRGSPSQQMAQQMGGQAGAQMQQRPRPAWTPQQGQAPMNPRQANRARFLAKQGGGY